MTTTADPTIYAGRIDLSNQNNSHTIAFRFIHDRLPATGGRILEIGCNTGYFGAALIQAGHDVTGVEISESAGLEARKQLPTVFIGSIESFLSAPEFLDKRYDCITFGDVLEHIQDPIAVLRAAVSRLKVGGVVVVSVPNVTHIAVRAMVMGGRWIYSDRGIMDRTHMRFFDKFGTIELLEHAGLSVQAVASVRVPASQTGVEFQQELLDRLEPQIADAAADIFQYVAVAELGPSVERFQCSTHRVLVLWPAGEWALGDIRLRAPLTAWSERWGGDVRFIPFGRCRDIDVEWSDVIVIQREASPFLLRKIRQWRAQGKAVVFDIDDLLFDVPSFLESYAHYQGTRVFIKEALQNTNHVTTTTERLSVALRPYAQSVSVTPNSSQHWGVTAEHFATSGQPVKLLIASSDTVRLDFLVPALTRVLDDKDLCIEILAIGNTVDFLNKAGIPVTGIPLLSYPEFLSFVSKQNNAIGIIPLDDSIFSNCKSPIKFLDYACCGVPSICSNVAPYSDVISNDQDGVLVANHIDAWYTAIKALALDPVRRSAIASAARAKANCKFSLRQAAEKWQSVIEAAISHAQQNPVDPEGKLNIFARRLRGAASLAVSPSVYPRAIRLVRREGLRGLIKRVLR